MNEVIVNIGECKIFNKKNCIIKITLGSCVGLILFSKKLKLTGAIHILLPEFPEYSNQKYKITAYADTGVKYLLNKMKEYSDNLNLSAILAGGNNLKGKDLFNIGMKNYINVKKILKEENINIIYEYCLKNYPVLLEFNTKNFTYKTYNIFDTLIELKKDIDANSILNKIEKEFKYLPVADKKLFEILKLKNKKDEISFYEIEKKVKEDDSLSFNLLKFANSAYISPANKITSIRQALLFIGLEKFFNFLGNEILKKFVTKDIEGYLIEANFYKMHVISVALLSEYIADLFLKNTENFYLAGLFHDIGKIILDNYASKNFDNLNRVKIIKFIEKSINSYAHSKLGALFIKKIGLKEEIIEAVNFHHIPALSSEKNKKFVTVVALANNIISNYIFGTGFNISDLPFSSIDEVCKILEIQKDDILKILDIVPLFITIAEDMVNG